jgi:hypothetical protein
MTKPLKRPNRCANAPHRYPAPGTSCGRRRSGVAFTSRAHGRFFRRTRVTSWAQGWPKIPCSRLGARNPGKENKAASVWTRVNGSSWSHASRSPPHSLDKIRERRIRPTNRLAPELEKKRFSHLATPIYIEPQKKKLNPSAHRMFAELRLLRSTYLVRSRQLRCHYTL